MSTIEGSKGELEKGGCGDEYAYVCLCVGDGDFTLHLLYSLITHSSYRYFSEPVTTLSNICQEADGVIITSHIKQKLTGIVAAMPRIYSIPFSVVKLTVDNFIAGLSGCHPANYHHHICLYTWIMKWRVKLYFGCECSSSCGMKCARFKSFHNSCSS